MTSLTPQQTNCLRQHLRQMGTQDLLLDELVDYLSCQAEELMSNGVSFEKALSIIRLEATSLAIRHLDHTLVRQGALARTKFWRNPYRSLHGVNAVYNLIKPLRQTLLIGVILNVMLTGWLLVSKGLAIPTGLVATLLFPLFLLLFLQLSRTTRMYRGAILVNCQVLHEEFMLRLFSRKSARTR